MYDGVANIRVDLQLEYMDSETIWLGLADALVYNFLEWSISCFWR